MPVTRGRPVSWHSLWYDHAVVAKVQFDKPEVNFVNGGANKQNSRTGEHN
nr:hypothetical protein [Pseudomonas sp. GM18]